MVTSLIKTYGIITKFEIINITCQKCFIKKSKNIKKEIITCRRSSFDRFRTVKNIKPNFKLKNIRKKLRFA
jgi:hypothetical protein